MFNYKFGIFAKNHKIKIIKLTYNRLVTAAYKNSKKV